MIRLSRDARAELLARDLSRVVLYREASCPSMSGVGSASQSRVSSSTIPSLPQASPYGECAAVVARV